MSKETVVMLIAHQSVSVVSQITKPVKNADLKTVVYKRFTVDFGTHLRGFVEHVERRGLQ